MNSKQRAYLRGLCNKQDAIFQIGKNGVNDNLLKQLNDTLEVRELIKISILETAPEDINEASSVIASKTNSEIVQVIGSKICLYREGKKPKIVLPK